MKIRTGFKMIVTVMAGPALGIDGSRFFTSTEIDAAYPYQE